MEHEEKLTDVFGHDCGLNADWAVSAWCVRHDGSGPNRGTGLYVMDNEDGTLALVWRDFETEDGIEEIESVDISQVGKLIQTAMDENYAK